MFPQHSATKFQTQIRIVRSKTTIYYQNFVGVRLKNSTIFMTQNLNQLKKINIDIANLLVWINNSETNN